MKREIFFHAILVIKRDESLHKLIQGFDMPIEQEILQHIICFCLNCLATATLNLDRIKKNRTFRFVFDLSVLQFFHRLYRLHTILLITDV